MINKDDWPQAQERMKALWELEIIDRVCIQVWAPQGQPRRVPAPPDLQRRWMDAEYQVEAGLAHIEATYYAGEAFPTWMPNLGPDSVSGYLGAELEFAEDTSWAIPLISDWEQRPALRFDPQNHYWQTMRRMIELGGERGHGQFYTQVPDTHAGGDCLAALRGQQKLCVDLFDYPEHVHQAMAEIGQATRDYYQAVFGLLEQGMPGSTTWLQVWSPGRTNAVQIDFLALISTEMALEFFAPTLEEEVAMLDHAIFHLDGPDCIRHLDWLLEMPGIQLIQWTPGAGNPTAAGWLPMLKRVQAAGKGLHLHTPGEDLEALLEELSPRGLLIQTGAGSPEEADALVERAAKATSVR